MPEELITRLHPKGGQDYLRAKNRLISIAVLQIKEEESEVIEEGKLKVTRQGDGTATMHVPASKSNHLHQDEDSIEIDPELRYTQGELGYSLRKLELASFLFLQRVFSIDTVVKPLPPVMAYNVSRNLGFFTRIFTQFFDPEGIANAQKSLGIGQEDKVRKVR
ncbi:uncharacterized protein HKW66_Vig0154090 [Vigna angularis]|uniref:Uncharacterized protein n=1 Tax=Phaseolus angularis TaxID=3914 RepID=A0A8T0JMK6_PHAAN|nr:uncharacterized protein HKW66_Vig0154090 [Vigna angularis]